jgi:hypothetical protein
VPRTWLDGSYELVVSPLLFAELERAFGYPKPRTRVTEAESSELLEILRRQAQLVDDAPGPPTIRSSDPGDNFLVTLAAATTLSSFPATTTTRQGHVTATFFGSSGRRTTTVFVRRVVPRLGRAAASIR